MRISKKMLMEENARLAIANQGLRSQLKLQINRAYGKSAYPAAITDSVRVRKTRRALLVVAWVIALLIPTLMGAMLVYAYQAR
jgi:hypothetical protein